MDFPSDKEIRDLEILLALMREHDLAELEIEAEGRRIRLRRMEPRVVAAAPFEAAPTPVAEAPKAEPKPEAEGLPAGIEEVKSPLVGTFYRAPSPEADPFVVEGDRVEPDTVLCIIEAMKVMNEIRAGVSGIVREILVKNGESVEYGQPLFRIEVV